MDIRSYILNTKETEVFKSFPARPKEAKLSDLAGASFSKKGTSAKTKGNSWVRNSLRKLVKLGLVEQVASKSGATKSGTYRLTGKDLEDVIPKDVKKRLAEMKKAA